MRRRPKILLLVACALIAIVALCFVSLRNNEPSYNGRTLSQWLLPLTFSRGPTNEPNYVEAAQAVQAMGQTTLPWLVSWSEYRQPQLTSWLSDPSVPSIIRPGWLQNIFPPDNGTKNKMALAGFRILQTNAATALPELERAFKADRQPTRAYLTGTSIGNLGAPAMTFLLQTVADAPSKDHARAAIYALGEMDYLGTNVAPAIPVLLHALENTNDPMIPRNAAIALGRLGVMPDKVMPALTNMFASADTMKRRSAIRGLAYLTAHTNLPKTFIANALADSDSVIHAYASNLAKHFAPDVLTNSAQPPTNSTLKVER